MLCAVASRPIPSLSLFIALNYLEEGVVREVVSVMAVFHHRRAQDHSLRRLLRRRYCLDGSISSHKRHHTPPVTKNHADCYLLWRWSGRLYAQLTLNSRENRSLRSGVWLSILLLPTLRGASSMIERRCGSLPWRFIRSEVLAYDCMGIVGLGLYRFGAAATTKR